MLYAALGFIALQVTLGPSGVDREVLFSLSRGGKRSISHSRPTNRIHQRCVADSIHSRVYYSQSTQRLARSRLTEWLSTGCWEILVSIIMGSLRVVAKLWLAHTWDY